MPIANTYQFLQHAAFAAMHFSPYERSQKDIQKEEQLDNALLENFGGEKFQSLADFNLFKVSDSNQSAPNTTTVLFDDMMSGTRVALDLTNDNIKRLQAKFDLKDFAKRADGTIRLSGKAEAFVSGWFGDIAYRQNYLGADKDNNGKIDTLEEFVKIKSFTGGFFLYNPKQKIATDQEVSSYISCEMRGFDDNVLASKFHQFMRSDRTTLADALNTILRKDSNLDGILMSIGEYGSLEDHMEWRDEAFSVTFYIREANALNDDGSSGFDPREILLSAVGTLIKQQELLQKLKAKGLGNLTKEEKELLSASSLFAQNATGVFSDEDIEAIQKELEDKSLQNLSEITGIPADELREAIVNFAKTLEGFSSYNTRIDKELFPVIYEIRTHVQSTTTFDMKA
ncbi:MAG: hypothetical protein K2N12_00345 [Helicobacter sp.]|nr:hypothetical protein [Helicobacter sp.]